MNPNSKTMSNLHESLVQGEAALSVVGLGYVGLPLAVEFGKRYPVTGFDISQPHIDELEAGHDGTLEVEDEAAPADGEQVYSAVASRERTASAHR